jgi:hypothetical protein
MLTFHVPIFRSFFFFFFQTSRFRLWPFRTRISGTLVMMVSLLTEDIISSLLIFTANSSPLNQVKITSVYSFKVCLIIVCANFGVRFQSIPLGSHSSFVSWTLEHWCLCKVLPNHLQYQILRFRDRHSQHDFSHFTYVSVTIEPRLLFGVWPQAVFEKPMIS